MEGTAVMIALHALKVGDKIETTIGTLTLDDRVLTDPSIRQWEPGWWAFDADEKEYFVGDNGQVYTNTKEWPEVWDMEFGKVTESA